MKAKRFLTAFLPTLVAMFALNGVFHAAVCADFFNTNLAHFKELIRPMDQGEMLPLIILEINLVFVMTYFILKGFPGSVSKTDGMIAGGLINLVSAGTWSLANASMFQWPVSIMLGDTLWHVVLGTMGGYLIATIYNWSVAKAGALG